MIAEFQSVTVGDFFTRFQRLALRCSECLPAKVVVVVVTMVMMMMMMNNFRLTNLSAQRKDPKFAHLFQDVIHGHTDLLILGFVQRDESTMSVWELWFGMPILDTQ